MIYDKCGKFDMRVSYKNTIDKPNKMVYYRIYKRFR